MDSGDAGRVLKCRRGPDHKLHTVATMREDDLAVGGMILVAKPSVGSNLDLLNFWLRLSSRTLIMLMSMQEPPSPTPVCGAQRCVETIENGAMVRVRVQRRCLS